MLRLLTLIKVSALVLILQTGLASAWVHDVYRAEPGQPNPLATMGKAENGIVHEVKDGDMIQDAVNKANTGDQILVYPGTYSETVYIDKDGITLTGVIVEGEWPTLEGEKKLNDAILYSGNNIVIENFRIQHYKGNGVMGQAGDNFVIRNNVVVDTGVYGIFPQFGKNGIIEHNILTGIEDAAIYVGMCDNIDVVHNEVYGNVAGIEIENSRHALVEGNYTYNNTGGILVFITPGLPIKTTYDVVIRNNFVIGNNHENFAIPGSIVAGVPEGTGILVMAGDDVVIENNIIRDNNNAGILITDLSMAADVSNDPGSEPNVDGLVILDNIMSENGKDPIKEVIALTAATEFRITTEGPDIIDTGPGHSKCIIDKDKYINVNIGDYAICDRAKVSSVNIHTMTLPKLAEGYKLAGQSSERHEHELGKSGYYAICSGCHAYDVRLIGPKVTEIQAIYEDNPEAMAEYIKEPVRVREDYAEMPPQAHLSDESRLAIAKYILTVDR